MFITITNDQDTIADEVPFCSDGEQHDGAYHAYAILQGYDDVENAYDALCEVARTVALTGAPAAITLCSITFTLKVQS